MVTIRSKCISSLVCEGTKGGKSYTSDENQQQCKDVIANAKALESLRGKPPYDVTPIVFTATEPPLSQPT